MSLVEIKAEDLKRAIGTYHKIVDLVNKEIDVYMDFKMKETKVVGWIFKLTVNKVEHDRLNNPFSQESIIRWNFKKSLSNYMGVYELEQKVYSYEAMLEYGEGILADEDMASFICYMNNTTALEAEKKIQRYNK